MGFLRPVDSAADQLGEKGVVGCVFVNKQERIGLLLCQSLRLLVGLIAVLINDSLDIGSCLLGNAFFVVDNTGERRCRTVGKSRNVFQSHFIHPIRNLLRNRLRCLYRNRFPLK